MRQVNSSISIIYFKNLTKQYCCKYAEYSLRNNSRMLDSADIYMGPIASEV